MSEPSAQESSLNLTSSVFKENDTIPAKYTCRGENISPPLAISDVPSGSKSLALIMHDPDAVSGDFVHWVTWNLPPSTSDFPEGNAPSGATQGKNSAGRNGYMGPCPPVGTGTHHYMFELYALDEILDLDDGTDREELEAAMEDHVLAKVTLTGLFSAQ
ncbi:hypothetical protein A3E49_03020 [Candidatus Saccharibacteria bacterium RIFCSPHIGHO2_12_FULL_49_19]|nr:MAG: hypothetical protein A2708_00540 [Candidatus Saccharibacteria bacterium RIFCSPHIGHO2_01_FULL_49_21]OGL36347.1 MAG: hypothetical protein A3E49_03020 [Candidatus Saccharibacteria bacterium RIFCSPHIGHO2_12_FULL_49_19]